MAFSRLLLHRQVLHFRTHGSIRAKRWSSLPAREHQQSNAAALRPEKRAGGVNEAKSAPADAAEVQTKEAKLGWPSISGVFSKMKNMFFNKQDANERMDSEATASFPITVTSKESHVPEHEAPSLFATVASDAVKEPECFQQSEEKLKLSGGEIKDLASPIIKNVNVQNVLQLREMADSSPTTDVAQTQSLSEVMGTVLQGPEDDITNSRREDLTMKGINSSERADANARCSDFLKSSLSESKHDKVDNGGVSLPRQDAKSHHVKQFESEKETTVAGFPNKAAVGKGLPLKKMKSAKQSVKTVNGMTNFIDGHIEQKNLSADQSGKHDSIKCLMDSITDTSLEHQQVRPRDSDSICQEGKLNNTGSLKLFIQLFDKEKSASRRQTTSQNDMLNRDHGAPIAITCNRVSEPSDSVVPVNSKSLNRTRGSKLKDSPICAQTRKRVQKATDETAACADTSHKVLVPETTKDPDVPVTLLKHPARTVKIVELPPDVTLHQLKESLQVTAGSVSNLFLGSSGSVAYAEFKSEDAKEMAIAQHSIDVAGNHLRVLRVDAPKTNIIRISNLYSIPREDISSICRRYGRVQKEMLRSDVFVDVYFDLSELPNMLNILNSLNGMRVGDNRLSAVPAPVFSEDVLRVVWDQPEGRRHLRSVLQNLSQKIKCNINTDELTRDLSAYYAV